MTRPPPKTGAELHPAHKLRGVLHRLTAGAARKPEAIVRMPEIEQPFTDPTLLEEKETDAAVNHRPVVAKITRLAVNATATKWLEALKQILHEAKCQTDDMWVLIHCTGTGEPVFFSTRVRDDIIAFTNQPIGDGRLHIFVKLDDLIAAVMDRRAAQLAIAGTQISYVSDGSRFDMPFVERMENEIVQPVAPPDGNYEAMKGLGSALTEATRFAKPEADHMALHAIQIIPLKDGTGNAEVVSLSGAMAYRRVMSLPKIEKAVTIVPNWLFKQPKLVGGTLGLQMAGIDFVWVVTAKGMIAGLHMPDLPFPTNYRDCFRGLDGRLDFTMDEARALRRALGQVGQIDARERMVGLQAGAGRLQVRGKETVEVTCQGGPMAEILVDPHLLIEALKVRGVISLEFKKEDPEHNLRLVGRDVAISVMPCYQNQS